MLTCFCTNFSCTQRNSNTRSRTIRLTTVSCSTLPAVSGYPHVTVPAGQVKGLPVGLSFFGRPFTEGKLIGYAFAFEQATKHRKPPRYLPTVELT